MTADYPAPMCMWCKRFNEGKPTRTHPFVCEAFPDGIPDDIWHNEFNHRHPHEGDHGLQFEPKNKRADAIVDERLKGMNMGV